MSSSNLAAEPAVGDRSIGDSFAIGLLVMLLVSVFQRCIGLIRSIGFCHFLPDTELGQWSLANSFFLIGVPFAVLSLPGSFGKFVEYFRSRGQFGGYFYRVAVVSTVGILLSCVTILCCYRQFGWLIFGQAEPFSVIVWCVLAFASIACFSFIVELASGLRQVRVVSAMQFTQSSVFTVVGVALVAWYGSWTVLLPSYAIATLAALIPGIWVLRSNHRHELSQSTYLPGADIWRRILPYVATLWMMNFLSNLFEVSDRYMLLHLTSGGEQLGQALVGQYAAGYILPNLLTSLALMLSGVLLPYLSADWEANNHERIASRLRQMMQSICIGFMGLSVAAVLVAPVLYHFGFGGRYELAQMILPISLMQATWLSLFNIAKTYMLCIERGRLLTWALAGSLLVNLGFNWFLIQRFGLFGAVAATSLANLVLLLLVFWQMQREGCHLGWGTNILCLTPLALLGGPGVASVGLVGIVFVAGRTEWLLNAEDRQQIDMAVLPKLHRLGLKFDSLWP